MPAEKQPSRRLNKANIAGLAIPADRDEIRVFDSDLKGFGIRIRKGGRRTWIAQYRAGGQQRSVTIGDVEKIDPDRARAQAKKLLAQVSLGTDPQAERAKERQATAVTLKTLADAYLASPAVTGLRPKSVAAIRRHLEVAWRPLHSTPLNKLDRRAVALRLADIARESGAITGNRARASLSAAFGWGMGEGIADHNPVVGTNKPAEERPRERVLTDAELSAVWRSCRDDDFGRIVRLLIMTGARREEVGAMRWCELDLAAGRWSLPGERTKNHRPHDLPLPAPAIEILKAVTRRADRENVFGEGEAGFGGWSKAKAALDDRMTELLRAEGKLGAKEDLPDWRLHDLRRTAATRMADLGVQPHVIEAALNHVSGSRAGVAGIYNRASYWKEKVEALDLWAARVREIGGGQ